jgi:pilus assembly protein Flp/PilA
MRFLARLLREEDGPTSVEYAVMLALILTAIIVAIGSVGGQAGGMWGSIRTELHAVGF